MPATPIAASSNKSWLIICVPVNWPTLTPYLPVLSDATSSISVPQVLSWPYFRWPIILPPQGHFSVHQKTTQTPLLVRGNSILPPSTCSSTNTSSTAKISCPLSLSVPTNSCAASTSNQAPTLVACKKPSLKLRLRVLFHQGMRRFG